MTIASDLPVSGAGPVDSEASAESAPSSFADITIAALEGADDAFLDELPYGVVGLDGTGMVRRYSAVESKLAGLSRESVMGNDFFLSIGVCMNNFLVAQRFLDEAELDVTMDYVLTFRMRPKPVKLRLLQKPGCTLHYVLVQW